MGYNVNQFGEALGANASNTGLVTVANSAKYPVGARVFVSNNDPASVICEVKGQPSATTLQLALAAVQKTGVIDAGFWQGPVQRIGLNNANAVKYPGTCDLSAYTTAKNARIDMEGQVVPGRITP